MAERPINYLNLWYRKTVSEEVESSFKSSKNSISITIDGIVKVAFATQDGVRFHAEMKTTRIDDNKKFPTTFENMVALLQTSLDKDPDNPLNPILRSQVLDQIKNIRVTLGKESESLEILELRVKQYDGRDREISQGHP